MREITNTQITSEIARLCIRAETVLPPSLAILLECAQESEDNPAGADALSDIIDNYRRAAFECLPICRDTGVAVVFADVGQDVHITGGFFEDAVSEGVRLGYENLRLSTDGKTPCVLHTRIVPGDKLTLHVAPTGCSRDNIRIKMLPTTGGADAVLDFIAEAVSNADLGSCAPFVLGVGLGGTLEQCALIAKRALLREAGKPNPDEAYADLERRALMRINRLGIGPRSLGGRHTALAVCIEAYPAHSGNLPCVVNIGCHAARRATAVL